MKLTKSITILILLMLLQVAVKAQDVNYTYDASGNRIQRTLTAKKLAAPPQKSTKDSIVTIATDINNIIAAEELSKEKGESGEEANGIDELTAGDIKVFPNPVQYKLNVQFNGTAKPEGCSLQLYDGTGRLFYKQASLKNQTEVDMQQAKAGNYYLVVQTREGKRLYWKVVKE